ncbi:unnamed protein product, partial [Meganyctiphanes norvegica]
ETIKSTCTSLDTSPELLKSSQKSNYSKSNTDLKSNSQEKSKENSFLLEFKRDKDENVQVYKLKFGIATEKERIRKLISNLMSSDVRKICFDAQELVTYLLDNLNIDYSEAINSWTILDPKIGAWLLNPDNPPVTFTAAAQIIQHQLS